MLSTVWVFSCTDDSTEDDEIGDTGADSSDESTGEESSSEESESSSEESESSSGETSPCPPGTLDCPCDEGSCEAELVCADELCVPAPVCGDGSLDANEECDDGNLVDNDGCQADCTLTPSLVQVATGASHTCALTSDGAVYCWGLVSDGRLGLPGLDQNIGDDELPSEALQPLNLGGPAIAIAAGSAHSCALLEGGDLVCWGWAFSGALGYGTLGDVGDNEDPADAGFVDVGGAVETLIASHNTTCVILEGGALRCWGSGVSGKLGLGNEDKIGDDETPASVAPVDLPAPVGFVAAGDEHTCAITADGQLYCWGFNLSGQLGLGHTDDIGDDEPPTEGLVALDDSVAQVAVGNHHTCVLTSLGNVRCWGQSNNGQLGYGNTDKIGDDELPTSVGEVELGGLAATQLVTGERHNCALLEDGQLRCWGRGSNGTLGSGSTNSIGDDELPTAIDPVDVGQSVERVATTASHTCVITTLGGLRCWGPNNNGRLGYGNTEIIGDDEAPSAAGDVSFLPLP
nr:DUF4215 domain-containing protein [Pseudenhygromyxa sp. WMMC2535]